MKSAYELAMERLEKAAPTTKLTARQKQAIAEWEAKAKARIAEREIALESEIRAATAAGDLEKIELLRERLSQERKSIQAELEAKKEEIHRESAARK
ncbi:MAG TPA: hypothetical protein PKN95_06495 [Verrucomicrobiota bacterium]|nr:hypothetical protein [Verrucomicrobiota bacterium]HNT14690.1 hypothetical protein [Verrucomicrobiota bacterium]